jgi:hypothetical protein
MDRNAKTSTRWLGFGIVGALAIGFALAAAPAEAGKNKAAKHPPAPAGSKKDRACSQSANSLLAACRLESSVDAFEARARCVNLADAGERAGCFDEIEDAREEAGDECSEQNEARRALCEEIGEAPYEPDMDPSLFQSPRSPSLPNPWFPLAVGNRWVFQGDGERIEVEVQDETKRIAGVDCIVVNDRAFVAGVVVEDTDDWFGLRTDGSVEYCGELSQELEVFSGDDPEQPQLVSIEGSFKAGVDGAKSGTLFMGVPIAGTTYRQEWAATEAEDVGTVLSTSYRYGQDAFLDQAVPRGLAELMCANADCVVVADTSTLSPDAYEHKYFARGVGLFLETNPSEGAAVPLIGCSHDPRCASLP